MGAGFALGVEDIQDLHDLINGLFYTFSLFIGLALLMGIAKIWELLFLRNAEKGRPMFQEGDASMIVMTIIVGTVCFGFGIGVRSVFGF